jgi:hypothetical protein
LKAVRLLLWSAAAYAVLLVLVRGVFPSESTPTISLTGIPLIVIVVMIARDLARKSTSPTTRREVEAPAVFRGNPVRFLSGQFRVAASSSDSYFENVVRARLKELLTAKVALEMGLESVAVRLLLSDPRHGPKLIDDESLFRMLYGPAPRGGTARMNMIGDAIDLIGAWKS